MKSTYPHQHKVFKDPSVGFYLDSEDSVVRRLQANVRFELWYLSRHIGFETPATKPLTLEYVKNKQGAHCIRTCNYLPSYEALKETFQDGISSGEYALLTDSSESKFEDEVIAWFIWLDKADELMEIRCSEDSGLLYWYDKLALENLT